MKNKNATSQYGFFLHAKLIAALALLAAAAISNPIFSAGAIERTPLPTRTPNIDIMKISHRGVKFLAPENTLPAIQKAIEMKYDYCEIDLQYSRDGVPVIFHDPFISGKTDGFGAIPFFKLSRLKKLDAGSWFSAEFKGTQIPTLEEVLQTMQGKINLYLDLKAPTRRMLFQLLEKYGFTRDKLVVVGVLEGFMLDFAKKYKDAPVMPSLRKAADVDKVLSKFPTAKAFNTTCEELTAEMVSEAHKRGVMVFSNVLGVKPELEKDCTKRTVMLGADAIQYDRPDIFLPLLEQIKSE